MRIRVYFALYHLDLHLFPYDWFDSIVIFSNVIFSNLSFPLDDDVILLGNVSYRSVANNSTRFRLDSICSCNAPTASRGRENLFYCYKLGFSHHVHLANPTGNHRESQTPDLSQNLPANIFHLGGPTSLSSQALPYLHTNNNACLLGQRNPR